MKTRITTIFWDLDGTLIDSEVVHYQAGILSARNLGGLRAQEELAVLPCGCDNQQGFEHLFKQKISPKNLELFRSWEALTTEYVMQQIRPEQQIRQSMELFNYFYDLGLSQSIVSNSPLKVIVHCLALLGIDDKCQHIFSRDSVLLGKPDPQLYLNALDYHQVDRAQCLCFEDSATGISAAKAARLAVIGVGAASEKSAPDLVCRLDKANWREQLLLHYEFSSNQVSSR